MKYIKRVGIFFVSALILTILLTGLTGDKTVLKTVVDDPSLPSIKIDGFQLHAESFGSNSNPLVIVLHGGPGGDYRALLPLKPLSKDYQLVFYDQRGAGLSQRVSTNHLSLDQYREELDAVIGHYLAQNKDRPVYLIGHSWGAMLSTYYISKYGEKIKKAVLADPGFLNIHFFSKFYNKTNGMQPKNPSLSTGWNVLKAVIRSWFVSGPDQDASADYMISGIMKSSPTESPIAGYWCGSDARNAVLDDWRIGAQSMDMVMEMVKSYEQEGDQAKFDLTEGLGNYNQKVLFITGSCNKITGADIQQEQALLFAKSEVRVISGAGHTMFGEKPEESMEVIRSYFQEKLNTVIQELNIR